jgi:AcrR family transcriptional regulator
MLFIYIIVIIEVTGMKLLSTKDDILHFALQEFSQKSYDEASLNAILKNSGISKGSFYYHFKDKKDLYVSLLRSAMKAKWDYIQSNTPQQGSIDDSIFQLFREQARVGAEFGNLYPDYHRLGRMFLREKGNPIYSEVSVLLGSDSERIIAGMIDNAVSENIFDQKFPRDFLVKLITFMFTHFEDIFEEDMNLPVEDTLNRLDLFVSFLQHGTERRHENG